MKRKIILLILSMLLTISLVLASCGTETTETTTTTISSQTTTSTTKTSVTTTATTSTTTTPTVGNWWDKLGEPEYGGTITTVDSVDYSSWDPAVFFGHSCISLSYERLLIDDWTLDREIDNFKSIWSPIEHKVGQLAESWEMTEPYKTFVFHIREGIRFQDIPPLNGREFTAYDVEYHFHRYLGLGSGFTKGPTASPEWADLKSVTATDKYTVVFEFGSASYNTVNLFGAMAPDQFIAPKEIVELPGGAANWENVIGTGPFILDDYLSGTSVRFVRNPNYWCYDEHYPQNKLPYADEIKVLIIPDWITALSALRTGKTDLLELQTIESSKTLKRTDPEIMQVMRPDAHKVLQIRVTSGPLADVKVRKAMQMAINIPEITETLYDVSVDPTIWGLAGPTWEASGYAIPFAQWPEEIREGFTFNPEGAKELLADAGYATGFDTSVVAASNFNLNLLQAVQSYLADIGINMDIEIMDLASLRAFLAATDENGCRGANLKGLVAQYAGPTAGMAIEHNRTVEKYYSKGILNWTGNNDPVYDAMYKDFMAVLDPQERVKLFNKIDAYSLERFWQLWISPIEPLFTFYSSHLKGFDGAGSDPYLLLRGDYFARYWKD